MPFAACNAACYLPYSYEHKSKYGDKPSYDKEHDKDYKHGEKDYDKE